MCNYPLTEVSTYNPRNPDAGIASPGKSGGDLFLRAGDLLYEGESFTHRFDCNTVGPVPVASGYGSRTLTHSAVHVLDSSKDQASSPQCEAISPKTNETPVVEPIDSGIGITTLLVATSVLKRRECYRDETQ